MSFVSLQIPLLLTFTSHSILQLIFQLYPNHFFYKSSFHLFVHLSNFELSDIYNTSLGISFFHIWKC
jgi:hypothetical protein